MVIVNSRSISFSRYQPEERARIRAAATSSVQISHFYTLFLVTVVLTIAVPTQYCIPLLIRCETVD